MTRGQESMLELSRDFTADATCNDELDFEAFLRLNYSSLLHFLRLRTGDEDARDIAQESLTRLLRYRDTEPAKAWRPLLYRIARNLLNEQYRRSQSHRDKQNVQVETVTSGSECTFSKSRFCPYLPPANAVSCRAPGESMGKERKSRRHHLSEAVGRCTA